MNEELAPETGEEVEEAPVEEVEQGGVIEEVQEEDIIEEPTIADILKEQAALKKEIDKANKRTHYMQRKLDRQKKEPIQQIEKSDKPREDDFDTNEEYVEELTDWKLNEKLRLDNENRLKKQQANKKQDFQDAVVSGSEVYSDFEEKVMKDYTDGGPKVSEELFGLLPDSSDPVGVIYWLANNRDESARIYNLAGNDLAREIGRIEIMVETDKNKVPQKISKNKITPSKPIDGTTATDSDDDNLSTADWIAKRNKQDGIA